MKFRIHPAYIIFFICFSTNAQDIQGKWKTFSARTGEARSIVEVFQKENKMYGRVVQILDPEDRDNICTELCN